MKVCCTCEQEKPLSEFNKKASNSDGLERYCKTCHRTRNKRHYDNNKLTYKQSAKKFKSLLREWYHAYKATQKCFRCGETKPWRLAFHHIDPKDKDMEISLMVNNNVSRTRILEEIEKCVIVCHNCHSDIHYEQENSPVV